MRTRVRRARLARMVQCSTLFTTENRVFAALAALQILAMPLGMSAVCALPGRQIYRFS